MISLLLVVVTGMVGWLVGHLPLSPVRSMTLGVASIHGVSISTILGWVNWIVPIGEMLGIFQLWAIAMLAVIALSWVLRNTLGRIGGGDS